MLVFEERGKPEYPEKNLLEQGREPTTNSTHIWRRRRDLNPGHIGGRPALSPLRHFLLPYLLLATFSPMKRSSDLQVHRSSDVQIHRSGDLQVYRSKNLQLHR